MKKIFILAAVLSVLVVPPAARAALSVQQETSLVTGADLFVGSSGDRVALLQRFLSDQTDALLPIYPEKIVSGYFGPLTKSAVVRFQLKNHIVPAVGYVGPKTRSVIGSLLGEAGVSGGVAPTIGTTTAVAPTSTAVSSTPFVLPSVPAGDVRVVSWGDASVDAYREDLMSLFKNISFESLDQVKALRGSSGIIQTVPVLLGALQTAVRQSDVSTQESVQKKLSTWSGFYHRFYSGLATVSVTPALQSYHKTFLAWALYNETAINSLLAASSTERGVSAALGEYAKAYATYQPSYQTVFSRQEAKNISTLRTWGGFLETFFSPVLRAFAAGALLPFGGRIEDIADICTTGELLVIGETPPPYSGAFFLYWAVYAANPYLYNAVIPSNSILGDQFPGPGVCNKGTVTYPEGEGVITFFGTSLVPYSP